MITIETRNNPQFLIDKLIAFLNEKSIDTWEIDDEDDFTLCSETYRFKAWMTIDKRFKNKAFNICIIESKKLQEAHNINKYSGEQKRNCATISLRRKNIKNF